MVRLTRDSAFDALPLRERLTNQKKLRASQRRQALISPMRAPPIEGACGALFTVAKFYDAHFVHIRNSNNSSARILCATHFDQFLYHIFTDRAARCTVRTLPDSLYAAVPLTATHSTALVSDLEYRLTQQYGVLMSTEEVAITLKMKSGGGVRMARRRGLLPLSPLEIANRRGQFYSTAEVAKLLASWLRISPQEEPM
jgi:hypothetical protein